MHIDDLYSLVNILVLLFKSIIVISENYQKVRGVEVIYEEVDWFIESDDGFYCCGTASRASMSAIYQ